MAKYFLDQFCIFAERLSRKNSAQFQKIKRFNWSFIPFFQFFSYAGNFFFPLKDFNTILQSFLRLLLLNRTKSGTKLNIIWVRV